MMRRRIFFSFLFALLAGCAGSSSRIHSPRENIDPSKSAVIFIPGYYGSALKDADSGERRFVTFRQLFGDDFTLALFQDELKTPPSKPLEVEGDGTVNALPWVKDFLAYSLPSSF